MLAEKRSRDGCHQKVLRTRKDRLVNPIEQEPREENRVHRGLGVVIAVGLAVEFAPGIFNCLWTQGFKCIGEQFGNQTGFYLPPAAILKILFVRAHLATLFVFSSAATGAQIVSANRLGHLRLLANSASDPALTLLSLMRSF